MTLAEKALEGNNPQRGVCGICPAGCWVEISFDSDGKISEVRADSQSELGMLCKLGAHSPEIVYSPDRLLYPLRRRGAKGTYDFERVSWEEAFDLITERLNAIKRESGPEATAIYTGRGSFEPAKCDVFQPQGVAVSSASSLLFPFGSPNTLGVGALCYVSFAMIAPHVHNGRHAHQHVLRYRERGTHRRMGCEPGYGLPSFGFFPDHEGSRAGAHVVVIDPRRTGTAHYAGAEWIPIRPGTDGALALGLCRVLIEEELYDESFIRKWTFGFDAFARYAQHFRPEVVESITGVRAETVRSLARRIARAQGASPVMYSGLEYSDSGVQAIRATFVLWAMAGQLDVPGGALFRHERQHVSDESRTAHPQSGCP